MEELKFMIRFIFDKISWFVLIGGIGLLFGMWIYFLIDILANTIESQRTYYYDYKFSPKVQATIYVVGTVIVVSFIFLLFFWSYS